MIHHPEEADLPVDFEHTAIKPLKAAASNAVMTARSADSPNTEPFDAMPMASPRLGLDVDLDALNEMSAFEASLPEVPVVVEPTAVNNQRLGKSVAEEGNLIDFEVMDFTPPEENDPSTDKRR